jgi:L-amino acid N-acyltransferase YncA
MLQRQQDWISTACNATPDDAKAIAAIYALAVAYTATSSELEPPTADEMRRRLIETLRRFPWLVAKPYC